MIKLNSTSIKNADVGDWLVVKPYGSYVAFAGVVIQQTDCSYAFMYLPECHTFPWGGKCNSVEKLIKELNLNLLKKLMSTYLLLFILFRMFRLKTIEKNVKK